MKIALKVLVKVVFIQMFLSNLSLAEHSNSADLLSVELANDTDDKKLFYVRREPYTRIIKFESGKLYRDELHILKLKEKTVNNSFINKDEDDRLRWWHLELPAPDALSHLNAGEPRVDLLIDYEKKVPKGIWLIKGNTASSTLLLYYVSLEEEVPPVVNTFVEGNDASVRMKNYAWSSPYIKIDANDRKGKGGVQSITSFWKDGFIVITLNRQAASDVILKFSPDEKIWYKVSLSDIQTKRTTD